MKLLLLVCLIGFSAANLLQQTEPALDESVMGFLEGAVSAGSLSKVLGIEDPVLEQMADDAKSELGRTIREALKELLERIKDHVDNGKAVGQELIEKAKELRDKLQELGEDNGEKVKEILRNIREKAKEALRKILERLGLGKRNLDDAMDNVARMKFSTLVDNVKEKLTSDETVKKIREYFRQLDGSSSQLIQGLKDVIEKLSDFEIKFLILDLFGYRPGNAVEKRYASETWDKIKNFFKDLNIKIQDHSKKFGKWVKDMWSKGIDKLKEKHGTIKAIAMEFIANAKDMSAEMSREALEFFRPYKDDLGTLWNKLVEATKEAIGKF